MHERNCQTEKSMLLFKTLASIFIFSNTKQCNRVDAPLGYTVVHECRNKLNKLWPAGFDTQVRLVKTN